MKIRGVAALGCLTAAMAMGVAACGGDDEESGGGSAQEGGGGKTLNVYSSLPLQGASRPQSEDVIKGIKLALKQKGGKCGDFTIKYTSLDDATAAAGKWEAGADVGQRPQGRAGRQRDRLHRRVQLGRVGDLDPDHQRGGHPAGQPVEHGARPDQERRGRRAGRARQVLPDGRAHLRARRADRHHPGRGPGAVHEGRGRDERLHPRRRRGVRQGRRRRTRRPPPRSRASRSPARTRGTARRRTTGRWPSKIKASGADAVFTGGIIDNNAPQLYKDLQRRDAGRQAVRPRRRRDRGLDQGDPGRRSRSRRT